MKASSWPNLPASAVTVKYENGTTSYYMATLSNVPPGYNVINAVYNDWCVDRRYTAPRNTSIQVNLYSSLASPPNLEPNWGMVNYILNHKQGTMTDIQSAIWYFIKMGTEGWWSGFTPSAASQAMVNDALANGVGYVPGPGKLLAVVLYPTSATQITIIELTVPFPPPVGGYSYSLGTSIYGYLAPYLITLMGLSIFLVGIRRKAATKPKGCKSTAN